MDARRRDRVAASLAALLLLALATPPRPLSAQAPTRGDSAAILLRAAEQLDATGRDAAAAALLDLILARYGDTAAADRARSLRARPGRLMQRGGRTELAVWGTLYGLWAGVAVPGTFGADTPEPYGLGLLAGGAAGFLAARAYSNHHPLSVPDARAITFGGTWGSWQGLGWGMVLDIGEGGGDEAPARFGTALAGGLLGIATGAWLANHTEVSTGTATMVNFGALWGTGYGWAAAFLGDAHDDALLTAALLGGNAGLVLTAARAGHWNMSRSRARLINIAGVAGLLGGLGVDLLIRASDDKTAVAIPLVTSTAGLAAGVLWTRDRDDDTGGDGGAGAGALLLLHDGGWSLAAPGAAVLPRAGPEGTRRAALHLRLFTARF